VVLKCGFVFKGTLFFYSLWNNPNFTVNNLDFKKRWSVKSVGFNIGSLLGPPAGESLRQRMTSVACRGRYSQG